MDPVTATAPPTTEPATIPIGQLNSVADYREAKAKGLTEVPNPKAPSAPPVDDTPDPEVENDPELRKAIDDLETPKENETPAEKAARTRRHKAAGHKAARTRLENDRNRLRAENDMLRRQLSEPRGATIPADTRTNPPPVAARPSADDPEPAFDPTTALAAFAQKNPDHPDPYAGAIAEHNKDWARWNARREQREQATAQRARQQHESDTRAAAHLRSLEAKATDTHPDFTAKVDALGAVLEGHPQASAIGSLIGRYCAACEGDLGAEIEYALAQDVDGFVAAVRRGRDGLLAHLGATEAAVRRALTTATTPPPQLITAAPAPHQPLGSGASASAVRNASEINSLEEYRANRERLMAAR